MPNLRVPLFITRILIAIFMLPWTMMRFVRSESAEGIAAIVELAYKIKHSFDVITSEVISAMHLGGYQTFVLAKRCGEDINVANVWKKTKLSDYSKLSDDFKSLPVRRLCHRFTKQRPLFGNNSGFKLQRDVFQSQVFLECKQKRCNVNINPPQRQLFQREGALFQHFK